MIKKYFIETDTSPTKCPSCSSPLTEAQLEYVPTHAFIRFFSCVLLECKCVREHAVRVRLPCVVCTFSCFARPIGTGVTPTDAIDVEKQRKPTLMSSKIDALMRELKKVNHQVLINFYIQKRILFFKSH
jgi:hypothetical protein